MINLLFNDELAPITSELMFLETDISSAVSAYIHWQTKVEKDFGNNVSIIKKHIQGELKTTLQALLPFTTPVIVRSLFIPTASGWTAYFDNGIGGTDAGVVHYLSGASQLNCRAIRAAAVPHTYSSKRGKGRYGAVILELYSGEEGNFPYHTIRAIWCMNDGGRWSFGYRGKAFPFEQVDKYKINPKKERFTIDMLKIYLENLDVFAFDEKFYHTQDKEIILVEKIYHQFHTPIKEHTLEDAQNRWINPIKKIK